MSDTSKDLTMSQYRVLAALERGPSTWKELAGWLKLHHVTALLSVRRLEQHGLANSKKKRLTPKGRTALRNAHANLSESLASVHQ